MVFSNSNDISIDQKKAAVQARLNAISNPTSEEEAQLLRKLWKVQQKHDGLVPSRASTAVLRDLSVTASFLMSALAYLYQTFF